MQTITHGRSHCRFYSIVFSLLLSGVADADNGTILFSAEIENAPLGCEMRLPENVLSFSPLLASQVSGSITTFQVKPLRLQLACTDVNKTVQPLLTIEGETPYSGVDQNKLFLTGTTNGVGFMVRHSADNKPIGQGEFYSPAAAIGSGGQKIPLATLNQDNNYQGESLLWIGLVGPLQPQVLPGPFHASLIVNVAFQ